MQLLHELGQIHFYRGKHTMKKSKRTLALIVAGICVVISVVLMAFFFGPWSDRGPWEVTIATATKGGTYNPLGHQVARVLEKLPEISKTTVLETAGSVENFQLLCDSKADFGFVFRPAIAEAPQEECDKIRVMARLYADVAFIVVRKGTGVNSIADLNAKKVYVGKDGSGTKLVAEAILGTFQVSLSKKIKEGSFVHASQMLIDGELDAAFFVAGKRSLAVKIALESGNCYLLDLRNNLDEIKANVSDLDEVYIPANFFMNQTASLRTVGSEALLMCRKDLDNDLVFLIENAFFDNIENLLLALVRAQDIRIEVAFDQLPENVDLHPGAKKFRDSQQKELLIATGAFGGRHHDLGKKIQLLLDQRGISARVIHTDGSLENARLLMKRPTVAIMQYDVAVASYWGASELSYGEDIIPEDIHIPAVSNLKRIATLHPEKVHIIVRRDKCPQVRESAPTVRALKNMRVCLGPERSGTRVLAEAILAYHDITLKSSTLLSVSDMVDRILGGELGAGFYVGGVPNRAIKTLLASNQVALLSIEPQKITNIVGPALKLATIDPDIYACQLKNEPAIETLETRAVLVSTDDLPFDIEEITEAIFKGAAFLGLKSTTMAEDLESIDLHPEAENYYKKAGLIPSKQPFDWLAAIWRGLMIIVILATAYRGLLYLERERRSRYERRLIYEVSVEPDEPYRTSKLLMIRSDIRESIRRKWWQRGKLDEFRRRELDKMIEDYIKESQGKLSKALLTQIRDVGSDEKLDNKSKLKRYSELEKLLWNSLENGDLDESQHGFLMKVLKEQKDLENQS